MAPKKKSLNGYSVFMMETQQNLTKQGAKVTLADMSEYCKKDWEVMSDEMKEEYRKKAKQMKNDTKVGKYTSIGEKVKDVHKQSDGNKLQTNAMYSYIDILLDMQPASYYLPKQKFILIHINSYTCQKEGFYFPAEISMAEFSLEKGLERMFHQLLGFDRVRTNAPIAPMADINNHADNYHKINVFSKFPKNYSEVLLKVIGFIMNKDVDEAVLNDLALDMPPIYTAHTFIENELMTTSASLFKLFESAVRDAERDDFNNMIRVYHLDKLFMNLKNACFKVKHPNTVDLALPSVGMATESLSKDMITTVKTIGCNFHENLDTIQICSNYFVCKWINIISAHCCRYFDIKLVPGYHYDFDLSKIISPVEEHIDKINISKLPLDISDKRKINKPKTLVSDSDFPAIEGQSPTPIQKPIWNKPNTYNKAVTIKKDDLLTLGDSKNAPVTEMNSLSKTIGRGRGVICQDKSNNQNQLNKSSNQLFKGRGFLNSINK